MSAPLPEIAVVVPTYERPALLPRLVAALEAQTLDRSRFEVVLVDNASTDDTPAVIAELVRTSPLRISTATVARNTGPAAARNLGWRSTGAPFVAFVDDDCVPEPQWLEWGLRTLEGDEAVGVVQGCTMRPTAPYEYTPRTLYREVLEPSPWFEGCNLFFRREALERTGGFDETIEFGGEDTAAGWAVVEAGWARVFEQDAIVRHDLSERPLTWHMRMAYREGAMVDIAKRYPGLRTSGFWRPWALRPLNVWFAVAVSGAALAVARRRPRWLALAAPYAFLRRPPRGHPHPLSVVGHWVACDASAFAGMTVASVRNRVVVL